MPRHAAPRVGRALLYLTSLADPSSIYPNSRLGYMNIDAPWPQDVGDGSCDLIHTRMIAGGIRSWAHLYSQVFR